MHVTTSHLEESHILHESLHTLGAHSRYAHNIDEATVSKIAAILQREFDAEITLKDNELKLIEQRLQQAQTLLEKLCGFVAYSILHQFYVREQKEVEIKSVCLCMIFLNAHRAFGN